MQNADDLSNIAKRCERVARMLETVADNRDLAENQELKTSTETLSA